MIRTTQSMVKFITVTQWNMLAQCLSYDFANVDAKYLEWNYRKSGILAILKQCDSDIICVQECDKFDELFEEMKSKYHGNFVKKVGDAKDGVAIFVKRYIQIEQTKKIQLKTKDRNDAQVALIHQLRLGNFAFLLVSTHLKSNEFESTPSPQQDTKTKTTSFELVRENQMRGIGDALVEYFHFDPSVPLILTGDLNEDRNNLRLLYSMGLESAYELMYSSGTQCFTTFKKRKDKIKCVEEDYILFSKSHFQCCELLRLPAIPEEPTNEDFLPNKNYPSDHLYLTAKLSYNAIFTNAKYS